MCPVFGVHYRDSPFLRREGGQGVRSYDVRGRDFSATYLFLAGHPSDARAQVVLHHYRAAAVLSGYGNPRMRPAAAWWTPFQIAARY